MDEWLDTLSVNMTTQVRIPPDVLFFLFVFVLFFFSFFFFFFLSLLARADICTAELATWGVGPDVMIVKLLRIARACRDQRLKIKKRAGAPISGGMAEEYFLIHARGHWLWIEQGE